MLAQAATAVDKAAELRQGLLVLAPIAAVALALYVRWVRTVNARGGRVSTERFGVPDLIITFLLSSLFMAGAYLQFTATKPPVFTVDVLIQNTVLEVGLVIFLAGFLYFRNLPVAPFLGLRFYSPARLVGRAALFLLCAYPVIALLSLLVAGPSQAPEEQQIVSYFRERAKAGEFRGIAAVTVTAVLVAPFFEELFFRGYFYPALKRYLGPILASIVVSALFACIHANIPALPALFVLAMCLTLAYEWSGSLFVPMAMHAMFNSMNLLLMYVSMARPPTPATP